MKIVIVGGGKVGNAICRELEEYCDIVLIDIDPNVVEMLFSQYDIQAVVGNGADVNIQKEATVEDADIFLAVTTSDELNMVSCIVAKELGVKHIIARVRNPEYRNSVDFIKSRLGITAMINPEEEAAKKISQILQFPTAIGVETFAEEKVHMVSVLIEENTFLKDVTLKEFDESFDGKLLICIVERDGEAFIPKGATRILEGDIVHLTGSHDDLNKFYRNFKEFNSPIDSTLIIGGGKMGYYLLRELTNKKMEIKLIEIKPETTEFLSETFPDISVIHADGTDQDILDSEGISAYDSCIALTGIDEENIIISIFSKYRNVRKSIAKVNRTSMLKLIGHTELDTIITPQRIIADKIVRFVRSLNATGDTAIENLHTLADHKVEALEFIANEHSKGIGIPLMELELLDNTMVAFIFRDGELLFPSGKDSILAGDRVVIVTTHNNIDELDDLIVK